MNTVVQDKNIAFVINQENKILVFIRETRDSVIISFPEIMADSKIPFLNDEHLEEYEYINSYSKEKNDCKIVNGHLIKFPKRVRKHFYALRYDLMPEDIEEIMNLTHKIGAEPYFLDIEEIKDLFTKNYYLSNSIDTANLIEKKLKPILELEKKMQPLLVQKQKIRKERY